MNNQSMMSLMREQVKGWDAPNVKLRLSEGNAKLEGITNFNLPAGHSCPGAKQCLSRTVQSDTNPCGFGIQDGPDTQYRCFAATDEAKYPATRNQRWFNFLSLLELKKVKDIFNLIDRSLVLPKWNIPFRLHVSGDFYSLPYFDAWILIAEKYPNQTFYAYTKALNFWILRRKDIPKNLILTASYGGKFDSLIAKHKLRYAFVVKSVEEAEVLKLEIDHDDSHAYSPKHKSFALLLHGTQPAGTPAAAAWSALKKAGIAGYGDHKEGRAGLGINGGGTTPLPVVESMSLAV